MSEIAIRVENLGKKYKLGGQKSGDFRESFAHWFRRKRHTPSPQPQAPIPQEFWALKDVSFEIRQGEAVGIIGRNGAGKSTLLKILSRITEPTKGRFEIFGRVSSLLEVGTGFHEELTGRENVYLNGTILGMRRAEVKAKFDEIVDFSGVEKFIDTPVKHYSSGMKVRLAFAVAAHLEPEILIIDEVLAVGDAEFQKKCLGKMEDVTQKGGRTVLFVSHNMGAVRTLCSRGVLLKKGHIEIDDLVDKTLNFYMKEYVEEANTNLEKLVFPQDDYLKFIDISVVQDGYETLNIQNSSDTYITIKYEVKRQISAFQLFIDFVDGIGNTIFRSFYFDTDNTLDNNPSLVKQGIYSSVAKIPKELLVEGNYKLKIYAANMYERMIEPKEGIAISLNVEETGKYMRKVYGPKKGLLTPNIEWKTFEIKSNLVAR